MVSKKKWFPDENRVWNGRVRNYERIESAILEADIHILRRIACGLYRSISRGLYGPNVRSTLADDDVVLGFIGIVVEYGLFELEQGIDTFIKIHEHFLEQKELRWADYIFGGCTPNVDNFLQLLDIKHAMYTIESVWELPPIGGTYNQIQLHTVGADNQIEPSTELEYDESYYLPIDDMVDLDKEAQIELANKQSLSKLKTEYLEAMEKWKSACKDLKLGGYKCEVDNHPAYAKWQGMLNRAYGASSSKWYDNVTVSESFKHYRIFKQWYLTQYLEEGWELDKDLLVKGNKVYCASRCCFLPKEINSALAINRSLIPALAEKYRKVLNKDIYNALL